MNKKSIWPVAGIVAIAIFVASHHSDVPATKCDRLAASPLDKHRPPGIDGVSQIDFKSAVPACQADVERHPVPRLQYELGRSESAAGNYSEAFKSYRLAAERGYARAQANLGTMYINGTGVPKSVDDALKWFRLAADQGDAYSQSELGTMYFEGDGVSPSPEEGVKWFRRAADQGFAQAQYNMGVEYQNGNGVAQSFDEAARWYRRSADQGYAPAQFNLALLYEDGNGVPQSNEIAIELYQRAADQGHEGAEGNLQRLLAIQNGGEHENTETRQRLVCPGGSHYNGVSCAPDE